jgi:phosphorylcholine metabolism protein LicD
MNKNEEGFGQYKNVAIDLLKKTIDILEEFDINYFLISGTLLGYVRHNDFIPWDDDIDLLVDETLIDKLDLISEKYPEINLFKGTKYDSTKICFSDGMEIPENENVIGWRKKAVKGDKYCWPFIDLFVYEKGQGIHSCGEHVDVTIDNQETKFFKPFGGHSECKNNFRFFGKDKISFFHNEWEINQFFPLNKVEFLGLDVNVPNNPKYFLELNYRNEYMIELKSTISHKSETINNNEL